MTSIIDGRIESAVIAARLRLATDLSRKTGEPIIQYCFDLIDWVLTGERKPVAAPTLEARAAVRAAVNVGLRECFGSENPDGLESVRVRRDSL